MAIFAQFVKRILSLHLFVKCLLFSLCSVVVYTMLATREVRVHFPVEASFLALVFYYFLIFFSQRNFVIKNCN